MSEGGQLVQDRLTFICWSACCFKQLWNACAGSLPPCTPICGVTLNRELEPPFIAGFKRGLSIQDSSSTTRLVWSLAMAGDNKPKQLKKKFKDAAKLLISLPVAGIAGLADETDQNILLKSRLRVRGGARSELTTTARECHSKSRME